MDIVISGTKGGWDYFTDKQLSGLFDIGTGAGIKALTQQAYAINYNNNNCIFTKYRIVKDVRGDKRIGFVAFSLFLPFDKKLSGKTIKTVLDRVENEYCQEFIPDGRNLEDVRENFSFLDTISNEYDKDICSNSSVVSDDMQSDSTGAAFVYYPDDSALEDIFDAPFQEEYTPYRQILFISNDLKGKDENPLVALQHSDNDLTGEVDLKNEYYYLNNYNYNKSVSIIANGKKRSNNKGENQIRAKWQVEIRYSKDDRCYEPIAPPIGSLSNPNPDIFKYLEINGNQIKIKYDAFNNPTPKTKSVTFEIKDRHGKSIEGAEIQIGTQPWQPVCGHTYNYIFKGEELIKDISVSARKGDIFVSDLVPVKPEKRDTVEITMHDIKKVEIAATNENGIVYDFTVRIDSYNVNQQTTSLEFRDEDIEKECYIEVSKRDGEEYYSGKEVFCPKSTGEIHIQLKKKEQEKPISMGKHGSASAGYSNKKDGSDIVLDKNKEKDNYAGTLGTQDKNYKNPKFIAGSVVGLLVLGLGIWVLCYFLDKNNTHETPLNKFEIQMYVEGDALFVDTLKFYKVNWENQKPEIKKGGGMFGGDEEKPDSTEYKEWDRTLQSIERAITKRNMLANNKFEELKNQDYSSAQQKLKAAINKIGSINSAEVGQKLGDVSALTLTQIADSINSILTPKEPAKTEQPQEVKKENSTKPVETKQNTPTETQTSPQPKAETQSQPAPANDITFKIIQYIRGGELDEAKLQEYKKTKDINQNLKNSIQLCLDFWALDGSGSGKKSKTYWTFREKVNAQEVKTTFENSKLKAFLDKMCQEGTNPSYSKQDKKKGLKQ
ncbi:hypothetical protein SAMD00024442_11_49 [Candidatus Symbiothrix dinenymphae]|nr:hypothetical protein SAMD00024442_11_49 [Candidatus Symbiothrix dinenymphae]